MNAPDNQSLLKADIAMAKETKSNDSIPNLELSLGSVWKPDLYVDAFVPESYLAINKSAAIKINSTPLEGLNFTAYIASFAGTNVLSAAPELQQAPSFSGEWPMRPIEKLNTENYGEHLMDCMAIELEARVPELQSYSLFGVPLIPMDPNPMDPAAKIYRLNVPGIREGTPQVALGDNILLRQLILDPLTGLPQQMDIWLATRGLERGVRAPGFTGYQISAVVVAIDRRNEALIIRADGFVPYLRMCNVSFIVSARLIKALQRAVIDVAQGLPGNTSLFSVSTHDKAWLRRMLFPRDADGTLQRGLPLGVFPQAWFDKNLNYEQMVRCVCLSSALI